MKKRENFCPICDHKVKWYQRKEHSSAIVNEAIMDVILHKQCHFLARVIGKVLRGYALLERLSYPTNTPTSQEMKETIQ